MVESKPSRPTEDNELNILTDVNRGKSPILRSIEVRNNLEINQAWSPKLRLTYRDGVLTWKATLLTLDQEHQKSVAIQVSTPSR